MDIVSVSILAISFGLFYMDEYFSDISPFYSIYMDNLDISMIILILTHCLYPCPYITILQHEYFSGDHRCSLPAWPPNFFMDKKFQQHEQGIPLLISLPPKPFSTSQFSTSSDLVYSIILECYFHNDQYHFYPSDPTFFLLRNWKSRKWNLWSSWRWRELHLLWGLSFQLFTNMCYALG